MNNKIKVAVVTDHHPVDMIEFHQMFWGFPEFECYIQNLDMLATDDKNNLVYDCVVYYSLTDRVPDEGDPVRTYFETRLGCQGVVLLHHGICCFREGWDVWAKLTGIEDRHFQYHWNQQLDFTIANPDHPITKGLKPFRFEDESYEMQEPCTEGTDVLITTDHPMSMKAIGWTRMYNGHRVFCYESGHDELAYHSPDFKEVLRRAILWCAEKI